ncbi:helix-turn-helix domain-containing protein [Amycolatopsis albispora]|uniref:HTH cro/C1-type domain-containing protein n=1 Tax=Amycolatopsis albispora TaxID=1804986 RepID=A0A344LBG0_9PSEU|nr:helix-turn-helix transcriptional regulator [Amycolatopsis albispora]AXB45384.1 hypothetical protein A4R43_25230 [Amycolatopsis albispora]
MSQRKAAALVSDDAPFGAWLRARRHEEGKSLEVAGRLAKLSVRTLRNIECRLSAEAFVFKLRALFRLADVLDIPREEMMSRLAREVEALEPQQARKEVTMWVAKQ